MLNNRHTIYIIFHKVAFLTLFCMLGLSMPTFAQNSTDTSIVTEPVEPTTDPVEENPTTTQENPVSNPVTTPTTPTTTTTTTTTIPTTTTSEPVVTYDNYDDPVAPVRSNTVQLNQPLTPEPETEDANVDYNPFELVKNGNSFYNEPVIEPKEEKEPEAEPVDEPEPEEIPMEERNLEVDATNPFELVKNGQLAMITAPAKGKGTSVKKKAPTKKKKTKRKKRKPFIDSSKVNYEAFVKLFGLLLIMGFLSFLTNSFRNDLQKIYRAFMNSNMMTQLYREKGSLINMPYIPLYVLFAFTGGTFIYLTADYYNLSMLGNKGLSWLVCIAGIGGFYLFKHLLLKLMSTIFPFGKEINQYHFLIGIFNQIIGLALIPLVTIIAFAPQNVKLFAIYGALGVIGIIFLNRFFRSVVIASKFIAFHKFHLIVYLCAVEIAPIFIIAKLLMG